MNTPKVTYRLLPGKGNRKQAYRSRIFLELDCRKHVMEAFTQNERGLPIPVSQMPGGVRVVREQGSCDICNKTEEDQEID
jgi:hypothetical protein